jgi:hypothetical protein
MTAASTVDGYPRFLASRSNVAASRTPAPPVVLSFVRRNGLVEIEEAMGHRCLHTEAQIISQGRQRWHRVRNLIFLSRVARAVFG